MTAHSPTLRREKVAFLGVRFFMTCPCGNAPSRRMDADEARDEMRRHTLRADVAAETGGVS